MKKNHRIIAVLLSMGALAFALPSCSEKAGTVEEEKEEEAVPCEKASDAVVKMGIGLNLNDTFEDTIPWGDKVLDRKDPSTFETLYNRGITSGVTMNAMAAAGFRTIRVPVTWKPHMDNVESTIDKVWLDRIEEVVNLALDAKLYCIVNVHHDAGSTERAWLFADKDNYNKISSGFKNIWKQVAERFKDYSDSLLFEGYNEVLDAQKTWSYPKQAGGIDTANKLNQDFVDVVRASGGRNKTRNLILSTYSGGTNAKAMSEFKMATDKEPGHLIVQIHSYLPSKFCTANDSGTGFYEESAETEIDAMFERVKTNLLSKGYPCIMGEFGAYPKKISDGKGNTINNNVQRGRHGAVYVRKCKKLGIVPLYWYNPMDYGNRANGHWTYPELKDSLINAFTKK